MEIVSFSGITLDAESVTGRLRLADRELVGRLIYSALSVASPAAAYRSAYVDEKLNDGVVVDGTVFTSRVLRRNLEGIGRVFPFVLTIGRAMDEIIEKSGKMLEKYLLGEIGNMILDEARSRLEMHLMSAFVLEKISCMVPGSLEDWPIEEQELLFSLLPEVGAALGVELTGNFLMLPLKSISGIYFPSEATFFSCQLCPRERCEGRKARYNKQKVLEYGMSGREHAGPGFAMAGE